MLHVTILQLQSQRIYFFQQGEH